MITSVSYRAKILGDDSKVTVPRPETVSMENSYKQNPDFAFSNSYLWIRIVDKKTKMMQIIKGAENVDNLNKEEKQILSNIFMNEVGSYGPMMFNITSEDSPEYWKMRNSLNPICNSILFTPYIKLETLSEDTELTNQPFRVISETLNDNENLNLTQIENLQKTLDALKDNDMPIASHLDLHNQIRIQNYNVEWINEGFVSRKAELTIFLEHEQLIKTKLMEYLLTPANKIKITTGFFNLFENSDNPSKFFKEFIHRLDPNFFNETMDVDKEYEKYERMINASIKDSEFDEWIINNFEVSFDQYDSATVKLDLCQFAYNTKEKFGDKISVLQLLSPEILDYLKEKGILKSSTLDEDNSNPNLVFVPKTVVSNDNTSSNRSQSQNKTQDSSFLVIDAANFMLHLLWLKAWEFRKLHNSTNPYKISNNFLVTFEVDASDPNKYENINERFNGSLLNYINISTDQDDPEFVSFSFFDFNEISKLFHNSEYTDACFEYKGNTNYLWNYSSIKEEEKYDEDSSMEGWNQWRKIIATFPQSCFIEENTYTSYQVLGPHNEILYDDRERPKIGTKIHYKSEPDILSLDELLTPELASFYLNEEDAEELNDALIKTFDVVKGSGGRKAALYFNRPITGEVEIDRIIREKLVEFYDIEKKIKKDDIQEYEAKEYFSYYDYPIYKVSTQSDAWLNKLNYSVESFSKEMINQIYKWRLLAAKNFSLFNNSITVSALSEQEAATWTWVFGSSPREAIKYNQDNPRLIEREYDDQQEKWVWVEKKGLSQSQEMSNLIESQLDSFTDLSFNVILHDKNYKNKVENGFKNFIEKMEEKDSSSSGNSGWLEILISDSRNHILSQREYDLYLKVQKDVFDEMDKNSIYINKYADNNIISLQSSSETQSDLPYQIGAFSLPQKHQEGFDEKLKRIRKLLQNPDILSSTDRSKVENRVAMLQLMANPENSTYTNTENIVEWINSNSTTQMTEKIYNSLSGSDFISSFDHIGKKQDLLRSLYDSLLFKANVKSFYVPGLKIFAPVFIYSSLDSSESIKKSLQENETISTDDIFALNSKVAPQTGLYKITKLSYSIDQHGNWLHDWEATKMDFGFLNKVYQILYENFDINKTLDSFGLLSKTTNFFATNFVLPSYFFSKKRYYTDFNHFPSISANIKRDTFEKWNFEGDAMNWFNESAELLTYAKLPNRGDEPTSEELYRKNLSYFLLSECSTIENTSENTKFLWFDKYKYQNLWPLSSNFKIDNSLSTSLFEHFSQEPSKNIVLLRNKYNQHWINAYPILAYNPDIFYIPYLAASKAFKYNNWWPNTSEDLNHFSGLITSLNANLTDDPNYILGMDESEPITKLDSFIMPFTELNEKFQTTKDTFVFNTLEEFDNALQTGQIILDVGSIITIQRLDHPSINDNLMFGGKDIKLNLDPEKYWTLEGYHSRSWLPFFTQTPDIRNFAWSTIEKYIITDSPSVAGIIGSSNDLYDLIESMNEEINYSLSSWKQYVNHSIDSRLKLNSWLKKYGLAYQINSVSEEPIIYYRKMLFKWAQDFIANFFDETDYKEPYTLIKENGNNYKVELSNEDKMNSYKTWPKNYSLYYENYVNPEEYRNLVDFVLAKPSMQLAEKIFQETVIQKLNNQVSSSSFKEYTLEKEWTTEEVKTFVKKRFNQHKKDFFAKITTDVLPLFLKEWIKIAIETFKIGNELELEETGGLTNHFSMIYDFILIHKYSSPQLRNKQAFSAIRWDYLNNASINNYSNKTLAADFITNMDIDQLLFLKPRNEKYFVEKIGQLQETPLIDDKRRLYDKWAWSEEDFKKYYCDPLFSVGADEVEDKVFNLNKGIEYLEKNRKEFGLLRVIVSNKFTYKNLFCNENWTPEPNDNKLKIIKDWLSFENAYPFV